MMFEKKILMEEIQVTKSLYPEAGQKYHKSAAAVCRQIERLGVLCWEKMSREERLKYLGEAEDFLSPAEMVYRLAYYCQFNRSYRKILNENMEKFFNEHSIS